MENTHKGRNILYQLVLFFKKIFYVFNFNKEWVSPSGKQSTMSHGQEQHWRWMIWRHETQLWSPLLCFKTFVSKNFLFFLCSVAPAFILIILPEIVNSINQNSIKLEYPWVKKLDNKEIIKNLNGFRIDRELNDDACNSLWIMKC